MRVGCIASAVCAVLFKSMAGGMKSHASKSISRMSTWTSLVNKQTIARIINKQAIAQIIMHGDHNIARIIMHGDLNWQSWGPHAW